MHRHPSPRARTASAKTGLLAVIALVMILAGLALYITQGQQGASSGSAAGETPDGLEVELLLEGDDEMRGTGLQIQITDKDDPTRLAAEILAERYDPDGPTIRLVEKPRAWLFGTDGAAWLIESDRGRFYIPEGEDRPREGTLTGNVIARRFEPDPTAASADHSVNRPDPLTDTPALTATTDEPLRFNLDILTFETDGRLEITTDTIAFAGRGAFVVLNESRESITTLRVDQGERLVYTPPAARAAEARPAEARAASPQPANAKGITAGMSSEETAIADAGTAQRNTPAGTGAQTTTNSATGTPATATAPAPPPVALPPKIDLYRVAFADRVEATTGPRTVSADRLTVWARLVDNQLPSETRRARAHSPLEAALAAVFAQPSELPVLAIPTSQRPATDDAASSVAEADQQPGQPADPEFQSESQQDFFADAARPEQPDQPTAAAEPVTLTWDGPLTVEPLTGDPDELKRGDDLALRFEATDGAVVITDTASDATAHARDATYFAQRERVELAGSRGQVSLVSPGTGRIENMNAVEIELAAGIVTIPTAGELYGPDHTEGTADPAPQTITWADSASFMFTLVDGSMTDRLERAGFRGRVRGASKDATINGETLLALFDTPEGGSPRLLQLNVEQALASDGRDGFVGGEGMEVHFASGTFGEDIDPTRAILTGEAFARREGRETIRGQWIDASLARDEDANVIVTTAEARGGVEFEDGLGTAGRGESLVANTLDETATITGSPDPAYTWVERDNTRISGPDIRLNGADRTVDVFGPGTFVHTGSERTGATEGNAAPARTIRAAWTGRMAFDDNAGTVLCEGGVRATSPGPDATIDTVTGDRLEITLDPVDSNGSDGDDQRGDDRLRFAEVFGTAESPARVESTRYADLPATDTSDADPDARVLSLHRLDAQRIRFAARDDRLIVPTAGRLFVLDDTPTDNDRARTDEDDNPDAPLIGKDGSKGTTLITWAGSMDFDRVAGRAIVRDDARIVNKADGKPRPSEVIANTITAAFAGASEGDEPADSDRAGGDLRWAIATGDALLRIENDREILADRLIYNPEQGQIQALGENGRRVEITDLARGTNTTALAVIWDLATDRITITSPGSIVSPE